MLYIIGYYVNEFQEYLCLLHPFLPPTSQASPEELAVFENKLANSHSWDY